MGIRMLWTMLSKSASSSLVHAFGPVFLFPFPLLLPPAPGVAVADEPFSRR